MDLKLQQAIVATRAGRTDVAQQLLAKLITEEPENAHAWFLLGHIVQPKDRQIRYLQKAVALDPQNAIAKSHIERMTAPPVPPPVIAREERIESASAAKPEVESKPPTAAPKDTPQTAPQVVEEQKTPSKLPEWLQDLESKELVPQQTAEQKQETWPTAAGTPKRETKPHTQKARVLHIPTNPSETKASNDKTKEEIWLLRILAILVIIAAIILGFLVLLILF